MLSVRDVSVLGLVVIQTLPIPLQQGFHRVAASGAFGYCCAIRQMYSVGSTRREVDLISLATNGNILLVTPLLH